MKTLNPYLALGLILILALPMKLMAAPTIDSLQVQGYMKKGNNTAVTDGTYTLAFGVFQNGTAIWGTSQSVTITNGLFAQALTGTGSNLSALPAGVGTMKADWTGATLNPALLLASPSGVIMVRVYAVTAINASNPQFDINIDSVPSSFLADTALHVNAGSVTLAGLATAAYTNTSVAGANKLLQLDNSGLVNVNMLPPVPANTGLTGTAGVGNGGTGLTTYAQGDILYAPSVNTVGKLAVGTAGQVMTSTGTLPQWSSSLGVSQGGTGLTTHVIGDITYASGATTLASLAGNTSATPKILTSTGNGTIAAAPAWSTVAGAGTAASGANSDITSLTGLTTALGAAYGGTGQLGGYTIGDTLYASGATTLSKLASGAAGTVLTSGGVGVAPAWSATFGGNAASATTATTATTATNIAGGLGGSVPYQTAAGATSLLANGTAGQVLTSAGTTLAPTWAAQTVASSNITGTIGVTHGGTGIAIAALGDLTYGSGVNTLATLAGNTSATTKYLTQAGTGAVSAAPMWATISAGDLPTVTTATNLAGGLGGQVHYQSAAGTTAMLANGTAGQVLQSNGTTLAPSWTSNITGSAASATTATKIAGGLGGSVPYQTAAGTTSLLANGTAGQVLTSAGTTLAPTWATPSTAAATATTATNLAGGLGGSVPYQTGAGATTLLANGTAGQVLQSNGTTLAPSWTTNIGGSAGSATTATTATNIAGGALGSIAVQTGAGATGFLADVATGSVLTSGGVGVAPAYQTLSAAGIAAKGANADITSMTAATSISNATLGINNTNGTSTVTIGGNSTAATTATTAIGPVSGAALTSNTAVDIGKNTATSTGVSAVTIGNITSTSGGANTVQIGNISGIATAVSAISMGSVSAADAQANTIDIGKNTAGGAGGSTTVTIGANLGGATTYSNTVKIGENSTTAGAVTTATVSIGQSNTNNPTGATTVNIGNGTSTSSTQAVVIGSTTNAANSTTIAVGSGALAGTGNLLITGHIATGGSGSPVVGGAAGCTLTSGNDTAGKVTGSTAGGTACTVTFSTAYAVAPKCVMSVQAGTILISTAPSTTVFSYTASSATAVSYYICMQ